MSTRNLRDPSPTAPPQIERIRGGVLGRNNLDYRNNGRNNLEYRNNGRNNLEYRNNGRNNLDYRNNGRNNSNYRNNGRNNSNYPRNGRSNSNYRTMGRNNYSYNQNYGYYPIPRGNPFNYQRMRFYQPNYQRNYNYPVQYVNARPRVFYNRNYRMPPPFVILPQRRQTRNRSRSNVQNQPRSRSRQRRPRQIQLNDFMPEQLRQRTTSETSVQNLPAQFNITGNTVNTVTTAPPDALPQRERFATQNIVPSNDANTDETQPFQMMDTDSNYNENEQRPYQTTEKTTTSTYRRRQRQNRQRRYRSTSNRSNRFALLADENCDENNFDEETPVADDNRRNNKKEKKKTERKTRLYLEPNRILKSMEESAKQSKVQLGGRGNQAYILASASTYDKWVRDTYEQQVWQEYLRLGTTSKHWAKEVVQRTRRRDDVINSRFVRKKIQYYTDQIAIHGATIADLQIQLSTYWTQHTAEATAQKVINTTADLTANLVIDRTRPTGSFSATPTATVGTTKNPTREYIERIEKHVLEYIRKCTQHVKKLAETRIQLARAQKEEYKALQDFQQVSTPTYWSTHTMLKPKIKVWTTKYKTHQLITRRIQYDLPPKFISTIELNFKLDEAIIDKDEAQIFYDHMRDITKRFRFETTTLYEQVAAREKEFINNDIQHIIESLPKISDEDETSFAAFQHYCQCRERRINLEIEQSLYFLSEQRVETENNNQEEQEDIRIPTLVRSLREDFLLQP